MILSRNRGQSCLKRSSLASSQRAGVDSLRRAGSLSRGTQNLSRKVKAAPEDALYQTSGMSRESDKSLGNRVISTSTDTARQGTQLYRRLEKTRKAGKSVEKTAKGARTARKAARSAKAAAQTAKAGLRAVASAVKAAKSVEKTAKGDRTARKAARSAKAAAQTAKAGLRAVASAVKAAIAAIGSLGPVLIIALVCFLIVAVTVGSIVAVVSSLSLKSEDWELTKTYTYITELDVLVHEGVIETAEKRPGYREYHYFINGEKTALEDIKVQTDTDAFLAYLDCKYQDYTLDGVLKIFGVKVRNEIKKIHGDLYTVTYKEKKASIPDPEPDPEPDPDPGLEPPPRHPDPPIFTPLSRGAQTKSSPPQEKSTTILEIHLKATSFTAFIEDNNLLGADEKETYDIMLGIGPHTTRQNLADPFPGQPWATHISSRFGWRIHPITGERDSHSGIDIAMPEGTPIAASINGKAITVSQSDTGYGNVVVIESIDKKERVLFAHCSSFAVKKGQDVSRGDIIAFVGSTGQSTGPHLHLQYLSKNRTLNPAFYLKGCHVEAEEGGNQ